MSTTLALLLAATVIALVDWWAVGSTRRSVEIWAKPAVMLVLVAVAATAGDVSAGVRVCLVTGAVLGLAGDVALLDDGETAFLVGLGSFAAGHLAYGVGAVLIDWNVAWGAVGAIAVGALLAYRFASRTLPGARRSGGAALAGAVVFYAAVISVMVVTSWGTASWLAAAGALLFAVSDWVLGHRRFVGELPGGRLAVMVPYHVGQGALIVGLVTA